MFSRIHYSLVALGLVFAGSWPAFADEPASPAPLSEPARLEVETNQTVSNSAPNQQLANAVAARLKRSSALQHYHIDVTVRSGVVELNGRVASHAQREAVEALVSSVPGVVIVVNRVAIQSPAQITRAQALLQPQQNTGAPPVLGAPPQKQDVPPVDQKPPEPTPIFKAPPASPVPNAYYPPRMPPYAWPSYAPYNNYSRVAHPTLYPYNAWPFIGPMYPFPKIPPGWRSVTLTWQDGFWWYGRNATGYDWWKIRYW